MPHLKYFCSTGKRRHRNALPVALVAKFANIEANKMQPREFEDAKLLWKMFYAGQSLTHVIAAAEYVRQNNITEANPVFYPLITAVYVLYGKPFKHSRGVGSLGEEIIPPEYQALHRDLLKHRDQVYAHSDAKEFEWLDAGQANQVRLVRRPTDKSLICSQLQTKPPLMAHVINLCLHLQETIERVKLKLFKQYEKYVPTTCGEYILNVPSVSSHFCN